MKDKGKAQGQLMEEPEHLRKRVAELESMDAEREQAEQALHESEEKYREVVERASDGIVILQDLIIQYANPRVA